MSRALVQAPVPFKSLDVRTHSGGVSPSPVAAPVKKKFVRWLVTNGDVESKRLQVQGDREKAARRSATNFLQGSVNLISELTCLMALSWKVQPRWCSYSSASSEKRSKPQRLS